LLARIRATKQPRFYFLPRLLDFSTGGCIIATKKGYVMAHWRNNQKRTAEQKENTRVANLKYTENMIDNTISMLKDGRVGQEFANEQLVKYRNLKEKYSR
jgi:hypothetical protein